MYIKHLKLLFEVIKEYGFKMKLEKCEFAKHSIKYLGHIIENGKVYPINDNLKSIREIERPKNKKNGS